MGTRGGEFATQVRRQRLGALAVRLIMCGLGQMLRFDEYDGLWDIQIDGLGVVARVSEIQNTELKSPKVYHRHSCSSSSSRANSTPKHTSTHRNPAFRGQEGEPYLDAYMQGAWCIRTPQSDRS